MPSNASFIERLKSNDPSFDVLEYDDSLMLAPEDEREFRDALRANTTVQKFVLVGAVAGTGVRRRVRPSLLTQLGQLRALKEVNLFFPSSRFWADVDLSLLCDALRSCRTLETLKIKNLRLINCQRCEGLRSHESLRTVSLQRIVVFDGNAVRRGAPADGLLDCFVRTVLETLPRLESFHFDEDVSTSGRFPDFFSNGEVLVSSLVFPSNGGVKVLRLNNCHRRILRPSVADTTLDDSPIDGTTLDDSPIDEIISTLLLWPKKLSCRSKLEVLNLQMNYLSTNRLRDLGRAISQPGFEALKVLDVSRMCGTYGGNIDGLCDALKDNCRLETLNLSSAYVADDGAEALAGLLESRRCSLKKLYLNNANVKDKGMVRLAAAIMVNQRLVAFSARDNAIGEPSFMAFANAVSTNHSLQHLDLRGGKIARPACQAFLSAVRNNNSSELRTLVLPCKLSKHIRMYLSLNRKGRAELLRDTSNDVAWIKCISYFSHNLEAVNYLIRANPYICQSLPRMNPLQNPQTTSRAVLRSLE